ncbi:hypothetical protein FRB99_003588 [Tulasnella sp. 403]|nr:hypothetical protein FRB99_003588 [Tulasnella sp. 403]
MTERLDYFSAGLTILYSLYIAVIRLFRLYRPPRLYLSQPAYVGAPSWLPARHILLWLWGVLCTLLYLGHVTYLSLTPRFDYSYNIAANVIVGMIHNLLWTAYSFRASGLRRFDYRERNYVPPYGWKPAAFALTSMAVMMLEVNDFPPWRRVIDAHALWHLSTVPLTWLWYKFLAQDATDSGWNSGSLPPQKALLD